jgi:formyltetrahydrofolate deformylase
MHKHILLIKCKDEKGLLSKVTTLLFENNLNIIGMKEHVDELNNEFYLRCEYIGETDTVKLSQALKKMLPENALVNINPLKKKNIVIYATKEYHCLSDLLIRNYFGELNADIKCVIANHDVLKDIVEKFNIPFYLVSTENKSKAEFENEVLAITNKYQPDYIVLAKFMRILSSDFVNKFEHKIINIHHSFLPAFIGANPYRQAFERGVKLIGATAHFVTNNLDEGPIITQKTNNVDHTYSVEDMSKFGKEIERVVLAEALQCVFEDRIFVTGNKTVIFD